MAYASSESLVVCDLNILPKSPKAALSLVDWMQRFDFYGKC